MLANWTKVSNRPGLTYDSIHLNLKGAALMAKMIKSMIRTEARRQALVHCLDQLKRQSRELLERCYAGKDSIRQIAEELRLKPNALYMTLKRLRRTLFDCINRTLAAETSS